MTFCIRVSYWLPFTLEKMEDLEDLVLTVGMRVEMMRALPRPCPSRQCVLPRLLSPLHRPAGGTEVTMALDAETEATR